MSQIRVYDVQAQFLGSVGFAIAAMLPQNQLHPRLEIYLTTGDFHKDLLLDFDARSFAKSPLPLTEDLIWAEGLQQLHLFYGEFLDTVSVPSLRASLFAKACLILQIDNPFSVVLQHHLRGTARSLHSIRSKTNNTGLAEALGSIVNVTPFVRKEI